MIYTKHYLKDILYTEKFNERHINIIIDELIKQNTQFYLAENLICIGGEINV